MKKIVLIAAAVVAFVGFDAPAQARDANDWIKEQQNNCSANPGYCGRQAAPSSPTRYEGSRYSGGYSSYTGYPYFWDNESQAGRTKREKHPEDRYQYCRNGGWVRFGVPCPGYPAQVAEVESPTSIAYTGAISGSWWEGDYFVTMQTDTSGNQTIRREKRK